ncbi:conserved exported hypothetical protein [Luteimonas sp. 9C]|uniref:hypothetical protein n=1 Tax=Luteimonas sp. 9C TaxID=2653148 RepID=UPI0012F250A0|nr:hypothetical protein [Luteimonas sp. 9C]VXC01462.1 conserved exported hypothetical protein [Luteimonas sp. 9C]
MITNPLTRWIAPGLLAVGLSAAALAPAPAHAQSGDDLVQVIVDVADVVLRGNQPYYRGNYNDRLRVSYDHRGRPVYYRMAPRHYDARYYSRHKGPPRHAPAHGWRNNHQVRRESCDRRGRCTVQYYDPRQDRARDRRWR